MHIYILYFSLTCLWLFTLGHHYGVHAQEVEIPTTASTNQALQLNRDYINGSTALSLSMGTLPSDGNWAVGSSYYGGRGSVAGALQFGDRIKWRATAGYVLPSTNGSDDDDHAVTLSLGGSF